MKRDHRFSQWLSEGMDFPLESLSGRSVIEIAEDSRVLIENHQGVIQYSSCCIGVKVYFGSVMISGCDLELTKMTREQLVISGRIESVAISRRGLK